MLCIKHGLRTFVLLSNETVVGRSSECGVTIQSSVVSRHHCRIRRAKDALYIVDLGSSNGTWVNRTAVGRREVRAQAGDLIKIGYVVLEVVELVDCRPSEAPLPRLTGYELQEEHSATMALSRRVWPDAPPPSAN
jgi:pSer/pThr/pTyr-binding forkhead associated (FHA) protein